MLRNSKAMADELTSLGHKLVSGGRIFVTLYCSSGSSVYAELCRYSALAFVGIQGEECESSMHFYCCLRKLYTCVSNGRSLQSCEVPFCLLGAFALGR